MDNCRLYLFGFLFMMSAPCLASAQSPAASGQITYETKTTWPGTSFTIFKIKRLDSQNVVMIIRVAEDATAAQGVFLGSWPQGEPKKATGPVILKINQSTGADTSNQPNPFSLLPSYVVDESNQTQFKAVPQALPLNGVSYGLSEVLTSLNPGSWLQMSVAFKVPAPAPNPDGTLPVQKVDVTLSQAVGPIKGVVVPPLESKN